MRLRDYFIIAGTMALLLAIALGLGMNSFIAYERQREERDHHWRMLEMFIDAPPVDPVDMFDPLPFKERKDK